MEATVAITTKNRAPELRDALQSVYAQDVPVEVIVVDDGSDDDTSAVVAKDFPQVKLIRHETSVGLVESRNEAAEAASTPYIFSIDDDAIFTEAGTVRQALTYFADARVGALAMPYINVRLGPEVISGCPDDDVAYVTFTFVGTAHAHRRSVFRQVGGYRGSLRHWGEERDYCIRLYDAGYLVALTRTAPIHHFVSPKRDPGFGLRYLYRNQALFPLLNAPFPSVMWHLGRAGAWNVAQLLTKPRFAGLWFQALGDVLFGLPRYLKAREPVASATFSLAMRLHQARWMPKDNVLPQLRQPSSPPD
ncbi:MAG: glycosyltransferase family 2 protein [Opitutales bacterium]